MPDRARLQATTHLPRWVRVHLNDRALEWFSAAIMLGWSATLAWPGDTLSGDNFVAFRRFGLTEVFWAWLFGVIGAARLGALFVNGRWPKTPVIRAVGALFGAVSWAQVAWLIAEGTVLRTGVPTPAIAVYAILAAADIFSIHRAAFDARYYGS